MPIGSSPPAPSRKRFGNCNRARRKPSPMSSVKKALPAACRKTIWNICSRKIDIPAWNIEDSAKNWLSDMDSNHDKGLQRALCYHYTTGQTGAKLASRPLRRKEKFPRAARLPAYTVQRRAAPVGRRHTAYDLQTHANRLGHVGGLRR